MDKKILIVDSNQKDRKTMKEVLSKVGYKNILFAQTGKDGIKKTKSENPDIVIVALVLTDFKGFDVCKEIKFTKNLKSKIILITGKLNAIEPQWKNNSNADAFITKTETYESLMQAITRLV